MFFCSLQNNNLSLKGKTALISAYFLFLPTCRQIIPFLFGTMMLVPNERMFSVILILLLFTKSFCKEHKRFWFRAHQFGQYDRCATATDSFFYRLYLQNVLNCSITGRFCISVGAFSLIASVSFCRYV